MRPHIFEANDDVIDASNVHVLLKAFSGELFTNPNKMNFVA